MAHVKTNLETIHGQADVVDNVSSLSHFCGETHLESMSTSIQRIAFISQESGGLAYDAVTKEFGISFSMVSRLK